MYIRIRGWTASPGKEVSADMCRAVGVGQEGKYFTLFRYEDEASYYKMQETVRQPRILPRLEGLGHETWELVVGESVEQREETATWAS